MYLNSKPDYFGLSIVIRCCGSICFVHTLSVFGSQSSFDSIKNMFAMGGGLQINTSSGSELFFNPAQAVLGHGLCNLIVIVAVHNFEKPFHIFQLQVLPEGIQVLFQVRFEDGVC